MAFLPVDQQNQVAPQGVTTANPAGGNNIPPQVGGSAGSGNAGGAGVGAKAGGAPNTASPTQFGGGAQNLQAYLTANAPQITSEANTISNNLNAGYGQISGDITNTANQFGQQVSSDYAAPNQAVDTAAAANPAGFASTPSNVSAFQGQLNDQYTGPASFETTTPYANIQNEVSTAVQDAGQMGTQAGLQNYFAGQEQNPTNAETTLDSLLLSGNPQANQQVQTAAGQYSNLTPQLANATAGEDANIAAAQAQAAQAQQQAQSAINPVVSAENTNLQNELAADQAAANTYNTNAANTAQAAQTQAQKINQILGTDSGIFASVPNYNLSQFLQPLSNPVSGDLSVNPNLITNAPTQANTATAQDYAETNALQNLIGSSYQDPLNQANASQAGQFAIPTNANATTAAGVTQDLAQWLQSAEEPAYQTSTNQLTNPSPGSDQAAAMQEAEQANFIQALEAADPGLAAALATPQKELPGGGGQMFIPV